MDDDKLIKAIERLIEKIDTLNNLLAPQIMAFEWDNLPEVLDS